MIPVLMLSGKKDLELLKKSIASLERFSVAPLRFRIISDGTICDRVDVFESLGVSFDLLPRKRVNEMSKDIIAGYPNIEKKYNENFMFRKIIDAYSQASNQSRINYCDSDVIAVNKFMGAFDCAGGNFFMDNGYTMISVSWRNAFKLRKVKIAASVNCGFYSISRQIINLQLIEDILKEDFIESGSKFHLEQTIWSVLAASCAEDTYIYDPNCVLVPSGSKKYPQAKLIHFTTPTRHRVDQLVSVDRPASDPRIQHAPIQILSASRFLMERARHKLARSFA